MRSRVTKLVGAFAPLLVLCGCAIPAASAATSERSIDDFYSVLNETQNTVGGDWENLDDPTARGCVAGLGAKGQSFPALRLGDAPRDRDAVVKAVVEAWDELGYRIVRATVGQVAEVQGRGASDEVLIFRVSDTAMTLQGESECVRSA
jgi:hypothetical protein